MTTKKSQTPNAGKKSRSIAARSATRVARKKAAPKTRRLTEKSSAGLVKNTIMGLLSRREGITLAELAALTGWKSNSVRGFLHGPALKRAGLTLRSEKPKSGDRQYFVDSLEAR